MGSPFPAAVLSDTRRWGSFFGEEWIRDFPDQISVKRTLADDGTPQLWQRDFAQWIGETDADSDRGRTTRVMRKLRRAAPREYEVCYRAMVMGESVEDITIWLNERALRNNIPLPVGAKVHYQTKDTVALIICGVEYARTYW